MVSILVCVARQIGKWNKSDGSWWRTNHFHPSLRKYELKAAYANINQYANINHFHPSQRVPLFDFDGPRIFSTM
jgi:hypothetical protein